MSSTTTVNNNPLTNAAQVGSGVRSQGQIVPLDLQPLGESYDTLRRQLQDQTIQVSQMREQINQLNDREKLLILALLVAIGVSIYLYQK